MNFKIKLSAFNFSSKFYKFHKYEISFKKVEVIEGNYYQMLGVSYDSDYEEIKKKYYALAKKYHPDMNATTEALEKFKKIKKAYEVLGDPNLRIAYDLENNLTDLNESDVRRESDQRYTNKYGKRVMRGPRTVKNFYWDKWSNFKTPKWSNLRSGKDYRAEYIVRNSEEDLDDPHYKAKFHRLVIKFRVILYLLFIFSLDIFLVLDNWDLYKTYVHFKELFFYKLNKEISK
jgi:hypothetical protein